MLIRIRGTPLPNPSNSISVDAVFGQLPADVGHIRLVAGSPGKQLDLIGIIGNIKLKIIKIQ